MFQRCLHTIEPTMSKPSHTKRHIKMETIICLAALPPPSIPQVLDYKYSAGSPYLWCAFSWRSDRFPFSWHFYTHATTNWHHRKPVLRLNIHVFSMHTTLFCSMFCDYSISQEICTRFLLCCALLWLYIDWFSHIHQAYFTGTVAI